MTTDNFTNNRFIRREKYYFIPKKSIRELEQFSGEFRSIYTTKREFSGEPNMPISSGNRKQIVRPESRVR